MSDSQVEYVAREIFRAVAPPPEQDGSHLWENQDEFRQLVFLQAARGAIYAVQSEKFVSLGLGT